MSTMTTEDANEREARIERMLAETRKFVAEQNKLAAEQAKLAAERDKLGAESSKLARDAFFLPWTSSIAALGGILAAAVSFYNLWGHWK